MKRIHLVTSEIVQQMEGSELNRKALDANQPNGIVSLVGVVGLRRTNQI